MNAPSLLDQGDRKIVGTWVVLEAEPMGFSGGLDGGQTERMKPEGLKCWPKSQDDLY